MRRATNLRDFIDQLERDGELARVRAPVSPLLEIAAIVDRMRLMPCARASRFAKDFDPLHHGLGGKALLFERVEGSDFPVAINVFGSYRRMELALDVADAGGFESIARRIASLTKPEPPTSLGSALEKLKEFAPLLRVPPKRRSSGICQQVVKLASRGEVDLFRLPILKCWPLDGDPAAVGYGLTPQQAGTAAGQGRYITFAGIHTIHADDRDAAKPKSHNIGMYRAQLVDRTKLAMHWHMHHDGASHWRSWKKLGQPMPIALCFGGEPVLPYAATAPLPPGLSELLLAGFLNGGGIPMVRAKTVPLWVPANSEIVIEGFVSTECGFIGYDPRPRADGSVEPLGPGAVFEGPFGDHTGFYSLPDRYPLVDVTAITHRKDAIYPTTIVGEPPQEDYALGKATERVFLPLLKTLIHDIVDYHLPLFGCFHNCAFVRIDKAYPLQARRVMHAIWGAGQMAWTKFIVVVDADVDVHDEWAVWEAVAARTRFDRDLEFVRGPLDILDHAAPRLGAGTKFGIDATRKIRGEDAEGIAWDAPIARAPEARVDALRASLEGTHGIRSIAKLDGFGGPRLLYVTIDKREAGAADRAIDAIWAAAPAGFGDLVFVAPHEGAAADPDRVLFQFAANACPRRDLRRNGERVAFDGTPKMKGEERAGEPVRDFPPGVRVEEGTATRVRGRWGEYGFGG